MSAVAAARNACAVHVRPGHATTPCKPLDPVPLSGTWDGGCMGYGTSGHRCPQRGATVWCASLSLAHHFHEENLNHCAVFRYDAIVGIALVAFVRQPFHTLFSLT